MGVTDFVTVLEYRKLEQPRLLAFLRNKVLILMILWLNVVAVAVGISDHEDPPFVLLSQRYSRVPVPPEALVTLIVEAGSKPQIPVSLAEMAPPVVTLLQQYVMEALKG